MGALLEEELSIYIIECIVKVYKRSGFVFNQSPHVCSVEWGIRGAREAAVRGDIII